MYLKIKKCTDLLALAIPNVLPQAAHPRLDAMSFS